MNKKCPTTLPTIVSNKRIPTKLFKNIINTEEYIYIL